MVFSLEKAEAVLNYFKKPSVTDFLNGIYDLFDILEERIDELDQEIKKKDKLSDEELIRIKIIYLRCISLQLEYDDLILNMENFP